MWVTRLKLRYDDLSHRQSLPLPSYDAIYKILVREFGDDIVRRFRFS